MKTRFLLFLLLPCAAALLLSGDKIVACSAGHTPHYYDTATSAFRESPIESGNCDEDTVVKICRNAFFATSHGVQLDESFEMNGTERMFECQPFKRAPEPFVPQGSWSDSLIVVSGHGCMTKEELREAAERECTQPVSNIAFGGQCGVKDTYLEVVFVCDAEDPRGDLYRKDLEENLHFHERQFQTLKVYAFYHGEREAFRARGDQKGERELTALMQETLNNGYLPQIFNYTVNKPEIDRRFHSRRISLNNLKAAVLFFPARLVELRRIAAELLAGNARVEFNRDQIRCDRKEIIDMMTSSTTNPFSELRPIITGIYMDYCRNFTLGIARKHLDFLGDKDGGVDQLMAMYKRIFHNGEISRDYLPAEQQNSFGVHFVILGVIVGVIALISCRIERKGGNRNQSVLPVVHNEV